MVCERILSKRLRGPKEVAQEVPILWEDETTWGSEKIVLQKQTRNHFVGHNPAFPLSPKNFLRAKNAGKKNIRGEAYAQNP